MMVHDRWKRFWILATPFAVLVTFELSSCGGLDYVWLKATDKETDLTERDELWGEFQRSGEYRLKYDLFLTQRDDWSDRLALGRTSELLAAGSAPSIREYESNPEKWPQILGIVKSGVLIKCVKLVSYGAPGIGWSLFPFAEILDGPHKGTIVEINTLRSYKNSEKGPKGMVLPKPDYQLVEKVRPDDNARNEGTSKIGISQEAKRAVCHSVGWASLERRDS